MDRTDPKCLARLSSALGFWVSELASYRVRFSCKDLSSIYHCLRYWLAGACFLIVLWKLFGLWCWGGVYQTRFNSVCNICVRLSFGTQYQAVMIEHNLDLVFLLLPWETFRFFCALSTTDGVRGSERAPGSKIACDLVSPITLYLYRCITLKVNRSCAWPGPKAVAPISRQRIGRGIEVIFGLPREGHYFRGGTVNTT